MLGHDDHEGATKVTTNVRQVRRGLCAFVVHPIAIGFVTQRPCNRQSKLCNMKGGLIN